MLPTATEDARPDPDSRLIFELCSIQGLPIREAASRAGITPQRAFQAHRHGRRVVADEMRRRGWTARSWQEAISAADSPDDLAAVVDDVVSLLGPLRQAPLLPLPRPA